MKERNPVPNDLMSLFVLYKMIQYNFQCRNNPGGSTSAYDARSDLRPKDERKNARYSLFLKEKGHHKNERLTRKVRDHEPRK